MRILIPVLTALIAGCLVFFFMQKRVVSAQDSHEISEFKNATKIVQKEIQDASSQIVERLSSFADAISTDKDFSIKLLVENDRSAPVVAESAVRFRGAMGFDLLDVTDSAGIILSSGHFPASAGNAAGDKLSLLGENPILLEDNVMGMQVLTFQSKKLFKIADIPFYTMGGITINDEWLSRLSPRQGISVIIKRGDEITGMQVRTISEVKNGKILINDKEYYASKIDLSFKGEGDTPEILVVMPK